MSCSFVVLKNVKPSMASQRNLKYIISMKFLILIAGLSIMWAQPTISSMYIDAQAKLSQSPGDALLTYETIIGTDSSQVNALIGAANLLSQLGFREDDEEQKVAMFRKAITYGHTAVRHQPDDYRAHLALSRAYGRLAQVVGIREQLQLSRFVKQQAEMAVRFNPKSDIAWHIIGKWHFRIADLNWMERTVADAVLGGVPKGASFEKARQAFEKAVAIKPDGISHKVELARTLIELDEEASAKPFLESALKLKPVQIIDTKYLQEARQMLQEISD